jgi:hypothetical protein
MKPWEAALCPASALCVRMFPREVFIFCCFLCLSLS